ncbi:Scramblase [Penicillium digitatum]|nr:Scramblase [Penicillium digitatum]
MWGLRLRSLQKEWAPARTRALSSFKTHASQRGPRNSRRRPSLIQTSRKAEPVQHPGTAASEFQDATCPNYDPSLNTLLSPVYVPEDPKGVLKEHHPATSILANSGIVVQRELEMMNFLIGFEQANKYVIMDAQGIHIGYMAEQDKGLANTMARQWFHTHRSFVTHVFDRQENEVLRFNRPFSWINSQIHVYDPLDQTPNAHLASTSLQSTTPGSLIEPGTRSSARISPLGLGQMRVIGEAQQQWAPLRRKYNLFTYHQSPNMETDMGTSDVSIADSGLSPAQQMQLVDQNQGQFNQFAYVDEPFLSWDFSLKSADAQTIGSVNRNFAGFAREIFTDTGVYAMRMDSAALCSETSHNNKTLGMTLDQRAVMLATAVSIDFDYFSRQHGHGAFGFPPYGFGMGGQAPAGGAAAEGAAASEVAAAGGVAAETLERVGTAGGAPNGMVSGATTAGAMAGYEAMQRANTADPNASVSEPVKPDSHGFQDGPQDPWGEDGSWGDEGGDIGDGEEGGDYFDW